MTFRLWRCFLSMPRPNRLKMPAVTFFNIFDMVNKLKIRVDICICCSLKPTEYADELIRGKDLAPNRVKLLLRKLHQIKNPKASSFEGESGMIFDDIVI